VDQLEKHDHQLDRHRIPGQSELARSTIISRTIGSGGGPDAIAWLRRVCAGARRSAGRCKPFPNPVLIRSGAPHRSPRARRRSAQRRRGSAAARIRRNVARSSRRSECPSIVSVDARI
jgi:hypothetical protein